MTAAVSVLFARADSVYKTLGCDVWDADRDARLFAGQNPVIAHPPCRSWGSLAHFAKPEPGERDLALWSVDVVRRNGGVLEHPAASKLWREKPLPLPGETDKWGGFTLCIMQWWWGHRAGKWTHLYFCGCRPADLPPIPYRLGEPDFVVSPSSGKRKGMPGWKPQIRTPEREATPPALAAWLITAATRCARKEAICA